MHLYGMWPEEQYTPRRPIVYVWQERSSAAELLKICVRVLRVYALLYCLMYIPRPHESDPCYDRGVKVYLFWAEMVSE